MDSAAVDELLLYIENDGDLYRQRAQPIMRNLAKKMLKGTYDPAQAPKAWRYLVDDGAKKYVKEFGSDDWNFSVADRAEAAKQMARRFEDEMKAQGREGVEHLASGKGMT